MARQYRQGLYVPKNPKKYRGDLSKIVYRSSWEWHFMRYCDMNAGVLWWNSEEIVVPYYFELDGKNHRYFLDFQICAKKPDGSNEILLVEIKPQAQIDKPKVKRITPKNKEKVETWIKNQKKWEAATKFANERGWRFVVLSEHDLGIKR